jgi:hypothetical protein
MNSEGCELKYSWPNLKYFLDIRKAGLRKTKKNLRKDSESNTNQGYYLQSLKRRGRKKFFQENFLPCDQLLSAIFLFINSFTNYFK